MQQLKAIRAAERDFGGEHELFELGRQGLRQQSRLSDSLREIMVASLSLAGRG